MSRYELLLFLHVLLAFVLIGGAIMVAPYALTRAEGPLVERMSKVGGIMAGVAGMGTLILGLLLVWDAEYKFFTGWIIGAIVLWIVASATGERVGRVEDRAKARPLQLIAMGSAFLILILMIWKPGA
jgi:hypothetical protein